MLQLSEELPDPEKMAAPLNKRKVLIIEDDNDIREFLREEIGAYFEVEVAAMARPDLKRPVRMMLFDYL